MTTTPHSRTRAAALAAVLAVALAGCAGTHQPTSNRTREPAASASSTAQAASGGQMIADELSAIARASQREQGTHGITETYYVNSTGTAPFTGKGDISWTTVYDPATSTTLTRYPLDPTYRPKSCAEAGCPQAVQIALATARGYVSTEALPTKTGDVYTFPARGTVITTKNGLITSVLIEDSLTDPSFTNLYEVNDYGVDNPTARQILHR